MSSGNPTDFKKNIKSKLFPMKLLNEYAWLQDFDFNPYSKEYNLNNNGRIRIYISFGKLSRDYYKLIKNKNTNTKPN